MFFSGFLEVFIRFFIRGLLVASLSWFFNLFGFTRRSYIALLEDNYHLFGGLSEPIVE